MLKIKKQTNISENKTIANYLFFSSQNQILNLPSQVFAIGVAISLITGFMLYWLAGLMFAWLYFYGMYAIHREDPQAFFIWKNILTQYLFNTSLSWKTSHCKSTRLIFIKNNKVVANDSN